MVAFLPGLAAHKVPRYTSYPTAAEFHAGIGRMEQAAALAAIPSGEAASLYVHIPYCHEICWYCGCNTAALGRAERLELYVDALLAELKSVGALCRGKITHVHFGGGSPNVLSPRAFAWIADAIHRRFAIAPGAEWAVEIDPRHLTQEHAAIFAEAGVRRASLGAQTFDLGVQVRINRLQPFRQVARATAMLRRAGVADISLDLMYGLPGQTLDSIASTIAQASLLSPSRVALFGYAHLPALLARQRMIRTAELPGVEARFWQSALGHALLVEAGYLAIGFDHFALPGDALAIAERAGRLRRNFQGFTEDQADTLIGIGASAISHFPDLIVQNEKNAGRYRLMATNDRLTGMRGVARSASDRLRATIIERILCDGDVDVAAIERAAGQPPALLAEAAPSLRALEVEGVVERHGSTLRVTPRGQPYARLVAAAFDTCRATSPGSFSRAV